MRTKYILCGGFTKGQEDSKQKLPFYTEILREAPTNPKILLVCFAKDEDRILGATTEAISQFNKAKWQEKLQFEIANELDFLDQIKTADVIYFHGGTTLKLLATLNQFPALDTLFSGKIVAGESAGANALAAYCYSPSADTVIEGLGILSFKIIPHYQEKYAGKLDNVAPNTETLLLPEYEFKVIEKDS